MGLFQKTESCLGVDIGAQGMKLVEIKKAKGRPQLWTYGILDQPLDIHVHAAKTKVTASVDPAVAFRAPYSPVQIPEPVKKPVASASSPDERIDVYASYLKSLVKEAKATTNQVTASLPLSYIFHAIVTLPMVPVKEIEHHVHAKVDKLFSRPVSELQVLHQVIPDNTPDDKKKSLRVLVTAAPIELIYFYTTIFKKAGLVLQELETEAFALERSLVGHDTATVMVVDVGAERTNFFIIDQGLPMTHRSIQLGGNSFDAILQKQFGLEYHEVQQMKIDMSAIPPRRFPLDSFVPIIDPMIKEIQASFDLFLNQTGNEQKRPEKIILTGGAAMFSPVISLLQDAFSMKVFVGDPWARVVYQQGLKSVLDSLGPRMAVSIGLAMRNIV